MARMAQKLLARLPMLGSWAGRQHLFGQLPQSLSVEPADLSDSSRGMSDLLPHSLAPSGCVIF